jgi:TRAP-type mannitol/chloroaromatic compound transport system permease small subunit
MPFLLSLSRRIDGFTEFIGRWVAWLVLAAVLISATNAVVRKAFNIGSNAFLEIQWYLFAAVFLLAAGYTMMRQEHVRIDVISGRFSKRTQIWIDVIGIACFLFPFIFMIIKLAMPLVINAYVTKEVSSTRGRPDPLAGVCAAAAGLVVAGHPGVSELIKRIAIPERPDPRPDEETRGQDARRGTRPSSCCRKKSRRVKRRRQEP